jgi:hypothetical protein
VPVAALTIASLVASCVTPNPETANIAAAPKTPASKTFTSFTPALRCMDDLMLAYGKQDITITTAGVKDSTQKAAVGTKEMLINAINQMSRKSRAFAYIDYDPENISFFNDAQRASGQAGYKVPSYYIRGAITQIDDNALESQAGFSLATPFADLGISKDQIVSLVSVDMNVGETVSRQIISDAGSSNTMAVVRAGKAGEAGGKIGKVGLNINISLNQAEGLGAAVRALIELGAIETMGQFTHTPYWKCLQIEKTNPKMREQARDWYDTMKADEQYTFVQRKLAGAGAYAGPIDGRNSQALTDSIAAYQARNQLIADGRPSFELYYDLLDDEKPAAPGGAQQAALTMPKSQLTPLSAKVTTDRGDRPSYGVGEVLQASVDINRDAFLYCFYQDGDGTIARLFPNRYQGADPLVRSRHMVLSSDKQTVKIRFDRSGAKERVACYASETDLILPPELKEKELVPLPVKSLSELAGKLRQSNPALVDSMVEASIR